MKKIKLPPSRIEREESVVPTVMVGQCVFAVQGKVSMIRVSNRPAEEKAVEILVTQILTGNPATHETLGIWGEKSDGRKIVFCCDNPKRGENFQSLSQKLHGKNGEPSDKLILREGKEGFGFGPLTIKKILKEVPRIHTIIISIGNDSLQPMNAAMAADFLAKLNEIARIKKISIILLYNQWNGMRKPKNGSFIGVAEKHFFSIAKLSYVASPDTFDLESFKSYRGHNFFQITVQFERDGSLMYERGFTVSRVVL